MALLVRCDKGHTYVQPDIIEDLPEGMPICPECRNKLLYADLRGRLAAYAHRAWSEWMEHLFKKCFPQPNGSMVIPMTYVPNLQRQMRTPYFELSDDEKESDLREADVMLGIVVEYILDETALDWKIEKGVMYGDRDS